MDIIATQMTELAVQILGIVIAAVVSAFVGKMAQAYVKWRNALKGDVKDTMLINAVDRIVMAVEQAFTGKPGEDKFKAAEGLLKDYAEKFNLPLSENEIRTLIESAVYGIKQGLNQASVGVIGFKDE